MREGKSGGLVSLGLYTLLSPLPTLLFPPGAIELYVFKFFMKMCPIAVP